MQRVATSPRPNWQERVEEVGLTFHTPNGVPYWNESAYYKFSAREIDALEKAGNDVHELCCEATRHILEKDWFERLAILSEAVPYILNSWDRDDFSLYGRFDFAYDGVNPPKLLEYNADTPTSLVEAAVAQWYWLEETNPRADQFNSIHEKLIAAWKKLAPDVPERVHLGGVKEHLEDAQTVLYIQDTCHQAGIATEQLLLEDVGWHDMRRRFVDLQEREVTHYFKLFPWEWMWDSEFADQLKLETTRFIEPMWKMLLSNKGILPILWELFPEHPNLLPAFDGDEANATAKLNGSYVRKPKLSREGANVRVVAAGQPVADTSGEYGEEGFVYQALAPLPDFDGNHAVCGVWIVNHEACGLGIREDNTLVTGNLSRFVPHLF
jgi:glutathionylspermidine synthase